MKRLIIKYVDRKEFEELRKKYAKMGYYESKKYEKLKLSPGEEIRCKK
ncbi:MAG: hypothetical protein QMD36_01715 [Candidatus Aenigmarchaeota archaeon]|nr:hypothetical protein [Candidatus Aenigmarchaeota archaeon]